MLEARSLVFMFTAAGCGLLLSAGLAAQVTRAERGYRVRQVDRDFSRIQARLIRGPVLGFVSVKKAGVAPLLGVPGAATVGPEIGGLPPFRVTASSAAGRYVLGTAGEEGQLWLVRDPAAAPAVAPLESVPPGTRLVALSPLGAAAALYSPAAGVITVLRNLPRAPVVAWRARLETLPGPVGALAVNDAGNLVLAAAGEGSARTIAVLRPGKAWRYLAGAGAPVSLAFLVNRPDAVYADGAANQVFLVRDPGESAAIRLLAGEAHGVSCPVAVAASGDNRRVVIANSDPGGVVEVSLDGAEAISVACRCSPAGLERLTGNAVFRLKEAPGSPVHVFDGDTPAPRVLVIPPRKAPGANHGGEK